MSQFVVFNGPGSSGAGAVLTLTGNDGLPVSPTLAGNINVFGDTTTITTSRNGANELLISAFAQSATAQTVDGSTITLDAITIPNNSASLINCQVIGVYPIADGAAIAGNFSMLAYNDAGTVTLINNTVVPVAEIQSNLTNVAINFDVNGTTIRIRVTGEGAPNTTVNWKSTVTILNQATP